MVQAVTQHLEDCLGVYRSDSNRIAEDVGKERGIAEGGYGRKQVQELIQNAADALLHEPGRIEVVLTDSVLYVANEGAAFTRKGLRGLLYTHLATKTGNEIGRFGLGFKSVSGITDGPQVFSTSVSFEFNRERTLETLKTELEFSGSLADVPALRLAWPIDAAAGMGHDRVMANLNWATTVVRLPLKPGAASGLSQELQEFDESICLFAPHVRELVLDDRTTDTRRMFQAKSRGKTVSVTTDQGTTDWVVVRRQHRPSQAALDSAGISASRESVTVSWAVPPTAKLGRLCAFFPVKSELTLSGRVNAPWKLSDDRINVIECLFNAEILSQVVPELVVEAREHVLENNGFGGFIDVLPARGRGREIASWADGVINEPVYRALRNSRSLPAADGKLHAPGQLKVIPFHSASMGNVSGLDWKPWVDEWQDIANDLGDWVHPECTSNPTRRSKVVDRLMEGRQGSSDGRMKNWLEGIVGEPTESTHSPAQRSIVALTMAADMIHDVPDGIREDVRDSRIVLLSTGEYQVPQQGRCFIASKPGVTGSAIVDQRVSDSPVASAALQALGITRFGDGSRLLELLRGMRDGKVPDWDELWSQLRGADIEEVRNAFADVLQGKAPRAVHVHGAEGKWVPATGRLFPGELRADGTDKRYFVDGRYHASDERLLDLLGIHRLPSRGRGLHPAESWLDDYRNSVAEPVAKKLGLGPQQRNHVKFEGLDQVLAPIAGLREMMDANRSRMTAAILSRLYSPEIRATYSPQDKSTAVIAPELWWVRRYGMVATNFGTLPLTRVFHPRLNSEENLDGLLPTFNGDTSSSILAKLGLRTEIDDATPEDFEHAATVHAERIDTDRLGLTYAWWCHQFPDSAPESVFAQVGNDIRVLPRTEVALQSSEEEAQDLREFKMPYLVVLAEDVDLLATNWGLMTGVELPITITYEASALPAPVEDLFPALNSVDFEEDIESLVVQPCQAIRKVMAVPGHPAREISVEIGREGGLLLVCGDNDRQRLRNLLILLGSDSSEEQLDEYERNHADRSRRLQMMQLRRMKSDAERLLALVGEGRLISLIDEQAQRYIQNEMPRRLSGVDLAELCLTMWGTGTLEKACKVDPGSMETRPPKTWNGSRAARDWVKDLGFTEQWAGRRTVTSPKPSENIEGPAELQPLHAYQELIGEQLHDVLVGKNGQHRAILTMPTGAGKTRVAVQTVIDTIVSGALDDEAGEFEGPILWMADTEELCEQAVDTWKYLWRARGRTNSTLNVSRYWGSYELVEESATLQVVVASWQKIRKSLGSTEYAWLSEAPIVLIDEAHAAIHKSYTAILRWLHRDTYDRSRTLVGLTATPFRGSDAYSDESQRLRRRFDDNILHIEGVSGEAAIKYLQSINVLSRAVVERPIEGGRLHLSREDSREFWNTQLLPKKREAELGKDQSRTARIVESILMRSGEDQILVFAASVENAKVLATVLTAHGRPAASIDQNTTTAERRQIIRRFKDGELKVLANYGVLSQGFDAPKINVVYITRPTRSKVLYLQMVGRGMRGEENGGTPEVAIVNLIDNIVWHEDVLSEIAEADRPAAVVPGLPYDEVKDSIEVVD